VDPPSGLRTIPLVTGGLHGALSVLFLFLLAGVGNFVEDAVQQFSGLSGGLGSILTGGLIAVAILPLKGRFSKVADWYLPKVERKDDDWVDGVLSVEVRTLATCGIV